MPRRSTRPGGSAWSASSPATALSSTPAPRSHPRACWARPRAGPPPTSYTESEVGALLAAARRLRSSSGLRPRPYATLIGLLSCTGLRISEALGLTRDDVDRDQGTLMIRETKFHKSQLIALHPTTVQAMETYARFRDGCHPLPATVAFFVSDEGAPLSYRAVEYTFRCLRA